MTPKQAASVFRAFLAEVDKTSLPVHEVYRDLYEAAQAALPILDQHDAAQHTEGRAPQTLFAWLMRGDTAACRIDNKLVLNTSIGAEHFFAVVDATQDVKYMASSQLLDEYGMDQEVTPV